MDDASKLLVELLSTDDWRAYREEAHALVAQMQDGALAPLCSLLNSERSDIRSRVVACLRQLGDDRAVAPLLDAAHRLRGSNFDGSIWWGLRGLDCRGHFTDVLSFAFEASYEVRAHVHAILLTQAFRVSSESVDAALHEVAKHRLKYSPDSEWYAAACRLEKRFITLKSHHGEDAGSQT